MTDNEKFSRMAKAYYTLLSSLSEELRNESDIAVGLREGLNKFLSNLWLKLSGGKGNTDYYSAAAKAKLAAGDSSELVFEHLVPKTLYIQEPCEQAAKTGKFADGTPFSEDSIRQVLERYWRTARITKTEDNSLTDAGLRRKMPDGWDGKDVLARYKAVGITLERSDSC